jgi:hypothetical protein
MQPYSNLSGRVLMSKRWMILAVPVLIAAGAEQQPKAGELHVQATLGNTQAKRVMVSCIRAGNVFDANETDGYWHACRFEGGLPPGTYEVRVEGEGVVTEMKRGILVTSGNRMHVTFDMKAGKGVHIVEYATGPLPREEITSRLSAVEAALAKLTAAVDAVKRR